ncbi:DNA topoisomerase family protein [Agaribacter flavus]|uniref:Topoisomerase DNA-binding C4 zinc finger domain-containing protein n=1 Tax=Agaribacter flavus TaxID=1902781 RepID=A0ABV7FRU8_9ALTE
MSKINSDLFSSAASQAAYGDCPECGAKLTIKYKGKSSFLACTAYPNCVYTQGMSDVDVTQLKVIEDSECPNCQAKLAVKKGRYGMFIGCTNFPDCHFISSNQSQVEDKKTSPLCPLCQDGELHKKQNRFGKFFYSCTNYPKCKFITNNEPVAVQCERCQSPTMFSLAKKSTLQCEVSHCLHEQNS